MAINNKFLIIIHSYMYSIQFRISLFHAEVHVTFWSSSSVRVEENIRHSNIFSPKGFPSALNLNIKGGSKLQKNVTSLLFTSLASHTGTCTFTNEIRLEQLYHYR